MGILTLTLFLMVQYLPAQISAAAEPPELAIFRKAYPDVIFESAWNDGIGDWRIRITVPGQPARTTELCWAGGRFLPAAQLANRDSYWGLLYPYAEKLPDPADFTPEEIARIRGFSSDENRRTGAGSPPFFFDALYDSASQDSLEKHIITVTFLGKRVRVHQRLEAPLKRADERITALARTDSGVQTFINELTQIDGYFWREIRDTSRRSFHSLGLAIDILPAGYGNKIIYWSWQKDRDPENWMLTPLSQRWMPPDPVIAIFEDEGFIWGGKWSIWDNMHFEYHPELIIYRDYNKE
ncbi:M15 family metallopeptidase [Breznakiella homolactica]|uniref:M15 family metallopeptidase n=1 Tax=Breznakiella homolactica TaxID=2798577 RepID=A0A7T7XK96_9SPIR|nr:M15 family metallopeptidase [Breznakiella homolactica]QQO07793.1 M15 family metallopeptidase [Breznakiella homolactica]